VRITANQLTIIRIICLPIPCVLLYGGLAAKLVALSLFALLGFTDYLDGVLARRYGTTPFGTLFDPIADKIFITVIYIPFVQLGYVPLWAAFLLFLREFLITEIRRLLSRTKQELRVTELAKSKTTIQMGGAAFILLVYLVPDRRLVVALFCLPLAVAVVLAAVDLIRRGRIPHRTMLALGCFSYILAIAAVFPKRQSALLYMVVILGFTYASGLQYLRVFYSAWRETGGSLLGVFLRLITGFLVPMAALAMVRFVPEASWMVILILSFDFASQGLDIWVAALGREERTKERLKRMVMIPLALIAGVGFFAFTDVQTAATAFLWISLSLSGIYGAVDFYGHRQLLLASTSSS